MIFMNIIFTNKLFIPSLAQDIRHFDFIISMFILFYKELALFTEIKILSLKPFEKGYLETDDFKVHMKLFLQWYFIS